MGLFSIFSGRSKHSGTKADTSLPVSVPYELQPGGIYMFEVKADANPYRHWRDLSTFYREVHNIDITFVVTHGNTVAIYPVPPAEIKKRVVRTAPRPKKQTKAKRASPSGAAGISKEGEKR